MKIETLLIGLPVIAAGPIATVCLCVAGKGDGVGVFPVIASVLIASGVAAAVSTAAHLVFKDTMPATFVSIFVSELLYVLFFLGYIYVMSEGLERSETIMWLPIMIPSLMILGIPTALSVSYGSGMIVRDCGESKNDHSQTFARRLIDDDDTPAKMDKKARE